MDGDAGPGQLNSADTNGHDAADAVGPANAEEAVSASEVPPDPNVSVAPSRVRGRWITSVAVLLVLLAGALGGAGYLALRAEQHNVAIADADSQALLAAKDCVAATHAPDASAMLAGQQKVYECMTADYATQAGLMVGLIADAYQVAQAKVEVANLRGAVERHLPDGTVQVLVAVKVKITNTDGEEFFSYRLRVSMQSEDGAWKIAGLDQVSS